MSIEQFVRLHVGTGNEVRSELSVRPGAIAVVQERGSGAYVTVMFGPPDDQCYPVLESREEVLAQIAAIESEAAGGAR